MYEWDLPRQADELAEAKAKHDKPENKVVRDGRGLCRRCGGDWNRLVHGC